MRSECRPPNQTFALGGGVVKQSSCFCGPVVRAYDLANRDEVAAAACRGRKLSRPAYKWSQEFRAAKRKPRGACLQMEPVAPAGSCAPGLLNRNVARVEVAVEQGPW